MFTFLLSQKNRSPKTSWLKISFKKQRNQKSFQFYIPKIGCLNSKPWFLLALFIEACPTSTASSVGCNGQETQICGSSWCREDSHGFQKWWAQRKRLPVGLRRGNVLFKKISLQKVWRHTPNCRCHVHSIPRFPPKLTPEETPWQAANFGCEFEAHMTRVGRQGGLHPPVLWGWYKGVIHPDCSWWRKSSSSSHGLETRLGVSINILLFAWHLDIHRWWSLSDFGGSIVVLEHEEMEQTDAIELGAHRGYASWVWRLWRNLTPFLKPKN